jgi:dinuclear metal center YbgI/SA1388 family protein
MILIFIANKLNLIVLPLHKIKKMKLNQIINELNQWAPLSLQESYDNSGLLVGDPKQEINSILISLDIVEETIEEAILGKFDLVLSHHPIIFKGLKSLTGKTPEERAIIKAIQHRIAIVAMHTNLDNVMHGVNAKIAEKLNIKNASILSPISGNLKKVVVYIPGNHLSAFRQAMFDAGAGNIGAYDQCSFGVHGTGTFRGGEDSNPFVGEKGELHHEEEVRFESIFPQHLQSKIIRAIHKNHPYEEPAYDIFSLENDNRQTGAGMIGDLENAMDETSFLHLLKEKMQTNCIRYTSIGSKQIKKVAFCGGSGSFLIGAAKSQNADVFITGDVKYHDFFMGDKNMMIADIGHYESEQFTKELLYDFLIENFSKFAVQISEHQTNPINYF